MSKENISVSVVKVIFLPVIIIYDVFQLRNAEIFASLYNIHSYVTVLNHHGKIIGIYKSLGILCCYGEGAESCSNQMQHYFITVTHSNALILVTKKQGTLER